MPPRRAVQSINDAARVTLHGNTHPLAVPLNDRGVAPATMHADRMLLLLQRSAQQEAALQTYLHSVHDANSPNYRRWLTPEQFGQQFGVSDSDLVTVKQWLAQQGFTVNQVSAGRLAVEFSGTFAQVENAFHTSLHRYEVDGQQHWANASDPQIPQALAPVVRGVVALHNFRPRSMAVRGPSGKFKPETNELQPLLTRGDTTHGYMLFMGPADAATIYDTPTSMNPSHSGATYDGTGVTIGIAGDSNIDTQQVDNYRATFGLPAKTTRVIVDGTDPGENGDAIEAYLDTEVSSGIAPGANVVLYTAADTYLEPGLFLAILRAVDSNAVDILNVSFGSCEAAQGTAGNQFIYDLWEQAAAQGISVTVSTGDSGSAGCDNPHTSTYASHGLAVNGLASTPYNVAVGGTDFDTLYSNFPSSFTNYVDVSNSLSNHRSARSYIPEEPWNDSTTKNGLLINNVPWSAPPYYLSDNIVGGGGGASACVAMNGTACTGGYGVPTWQSSFAADKSGRNLPDVSLLAGDGVYGATWALCTDQDYISATQTQPDCAGTPTTGSNFNVTGVGGTSASAPAFAGMLALAAQKSGGRLGQVDYELYNLAKTKYSTVFHDISTGNNSVPCGNGTPDCIAASMINTYYLSGFATAAGYDEASGLGSVDATQMLSNWGSTGATATTSSLTLNGSTSALTLTHGDAVSVQVNVSGSGSTPTGPVALVDSLTPATLPYSGAVDTFDLSSGSLSSTVHNLPGGSYNVSAHYAGDGTFAVSDSNSIAVTVNPEDSTTDLKVREYFDPITGKQSSTPFYGYVYVLDAQPYGSSSSLSSPDGLASGTVAFQSGATPLGQATLSSDGIAELLTGMIPGGSNSLTAAFPGDASFKSSVSDAVALTVQPAPTALSIATDKESYNAGEPVTMTATFVTSSNNKHLDSIGAVPTGLVTFIADGTSTLGTATVTGNSGSITSLASASSAFVAQNMAAGKSHNITATYSGDANYASGSTASPAFIQIVNAFTTIAFTLSSSNIQQNQTLDLTVSLTTWGNLPPPSGTATFVVSQTGGLPNWGTTPTAILTNGTGTVTIPANTLPLGNFSVSAYYTGDNLYGTAYSNIKTLTVTGSGTVAPTLNLTLPSTPVNHALPITLNVTGPSGDPAATGPVIVDNSNSHGVVVNGVATFTDNGNWPSGPNTFTVTYLGDTTYSAGTVTGKFTQMGIAPMIVSPFNPTVYVGNPLTFTIAVSQVGKLPVPTGTITLSRGTYASAATPLTGGSATITIPENTMAVGSGVLMVSYSGDAYYIANQTSDLVQVTSALPSFKVSGSDLAVTAGSASGNTSTVTIMPADGFTGNVNLTAQITQSPANAVYPPTLSFGGTNTVNINGSNGVIATLIVTTTAPTTAMLRTAPWPEKRWLGAAGGSALGCVLLMMLPRRRLWQKWLTLCWLCISLVAGISACGGGGGTGGSGGGSGSGSGGGSTGGTTAGAYTITITGTSGTLTATSTIALTVR